MKTRFLRSAAALMLVCTLLFSLTGCDSLDYREAIDLYNNGAYEEAAERFAQLGDYEDSVRLEKRCRYHMAVDTMEAGSYEDAITQLEALNGYEDSDARITECTYQLAIATFEGGDLSSAEAIFLEISNYRQAQEYLRRINWQKFFDAVAEAGTESGASFTLQAEQDGKIFGLTADFADSNQLIFFVSSSRDMGYRFHDDLVISLLRDSTDAEFTATSTFSMDFSDNVIGSQQTASGKVDITACTPETTLVIDTFEKTVTDNLGNTTTSNDPADSLMNEAMDENLHGLMAVVPELLVQSGIELTLRDIGFAAM